MPEPGTYLVSCSTDPEQTLEQRTIAVHRHYLAALMWIEALVEADTAAVSAVPTTSAAASTVAITIDDSNSSLTGIAAAHIVYEFITLLSLGAGADAGSPVYGEADAVYGARPGRARRDEVRVVPVADVAGTPDTTGRKEA